MLIPPPKFLIARSPSNNEILLPTMGPIKTLYTCHKRSGRFPKPIRYDDLKNNAPTNHVSLGMSLLHTAGISSNIYVRGESSLCDS